MNVDFLSQEDSRFIQIANFLELYSKEGRVNNIGYLYELAENTGLSGVGLLHLWDQLPNFLGLNKHTIIKTLVIPKSWFESSEIQLNARLNLNKEVFTNSRVVN